MIVYRLVQRRGSSVAHAIYPGTEDTICYQWAPGYASWTVKANELPLCKRCAQKLAAES